MTRSGPDIDFTEGEKVPRRSLYFRHAYEKQMRFLVLFDEASPNECYRRTESIVPQQALALANSELTLVQARIIARELAEQAAGDSARFVTAAFERVLSRMPTADEMALTTAFLDKQSRTLTPAGEQQLAAAGAAAGDPKSPATQPNLRARENLVHVLLNHNDFLTVR